LPTSILKMDATFFLSLIFSKLNHILSCSPKSGWVYFIRGYINVLPTFYMLNKMCISVRCQILSKIFYKISFDFLFNCISIGCPKKTYYRNTITTIEKKVWNPINRYIRYFYSNVFFLSFSSNCATK